MPRIRALGAFFCKMEAMGLKPRSGANSIPRGRKSFAETHPDPAAQWHPTKNGALGPSDFGAGSKQKVWWKCPEGIDHEWKTAIASRTGKRKTKCPCCTGQKLSVTNSLATLRPDLAAQWHPTKNGELTPSDIVAGARTKAVEASGLRPSG